MEFSHHGNSGSGGGRREEEEAASSSSTSTLQWAPPQAKSTTVEKEHMFDKVVTPSDVGKLNRLVIPKQHAERYFPLDTATHEKGLLLNFEDRTGKPWRFRYSYWNSSQSYVMTKGWSRFVKEKRLDAGDTVSFGRGIEDKDRFFIDWKRRPEIHGGPARVPRIPLPLNYHPMVSFGTAVGPWGSVYKAGGDGRGRGGQFLVFRSAVDPPPPQSLAQLGGGGGGGNFYQHPVVLDSVPVVQSGQAAAAKRVRLFGVNLDFPDLDASASFSSSASPSPKGKEREEPSLDLEM